MNETNKNMITTIRTKNGFEAVKTTEGLSSSSLVLKAIKNYFHYWINNNASDDLKKMYTEYCEEVDGTYYSMAGAIEEGVNLLMQHIEENEIKFMTTKDFYKIDFESVWE
jgi:hypothetical protein